MLVEVPYGIHSSFKCYETYSMYTIHLWKTAFCWISYPKDIYSLNCHFQITQPIKDPFVFKALYILQGTQHKEL